MAEDDKKKASKAQKKVPGRIMRTLKTSSLGSLVSGSYIGGKVIDKFRSKDKQEEAASNRHKKNAKRVLETMAELRGPIMKVGQLLSTHREVLPDSYTGMLSSLQSKAPPMPYANVASIIEEELGSPPEEVFDRFEKEAHAAASIGQVHRAWLDDGTPVAVKVQYPGADSMVDSDLKNLQLGMKLVKSIGADVMRNKKFDLTPIYEEIAEHIRQETDLCREAFNAQLLGEVFEDHPDIVVPEVYLEYSGLRMVTYEFIEGQNIGDFIDQNLDVDNPDADQDKRERIAGLLTDAYWGQFARAGVLHADPHPGNYFVTPEMKLALLDFGCVKIFEDDIVSGFMSLTRAWLEDDREAIHSALMALDMFDDPDDDEEFDDLQRIGEYLCMGLDQEVYSFAENNYAQKGQDLIQYFMSRRRIPKAQKEFIFMTRVILGYFEYFSRMKLEMSFRNIAMPHIQRGWQGRVVTIPDFYMPQR